MVSVGALLVGALFDDASLIHDQDHARITNRGEAMGDDEARPSLHQRRHRPLDAPQILSGALCPRIFGGEFVEQFALHAPLETQVHDAARIRITSPSATRHGN